MYEAYQATSLAQAVEWVNNSEGTLVNITAAPMRVDGMEGFLYIVVVKKNSKVTLKGETA